MQNIYKTIHKFSSDEIIIKKSKFIGYAKPIESEKEAISFIEKIKKKHKDATHNVPVYILGENNDIQRYSDDGEPSGTAGIPILEVLKKENLRNVVVVVTRYFGGIKLGTGGLVRAYIKAAKIALKAAKIVEKILFSKIKIRIEYTMYGKIKNELIKHGYYIEKVEYDDFVNIILLCKAHDEDNLNKLVINLTSAKATISNIGQQYHSTINGKIIDD